MDVLGFINTDGKKEILNPAYNKKSAKTGVPKTIIVDDFSPQNDPITQMALQDYRNQYSVDSKFNEKYRRYGLDWNPNNDMEKLIADRQSNWEKAYHALGQTLISEIGLGTVKAFTDLYDAIASKVLHVQEDDYQNVASEKLKEWQDIFNNEIAPIYVTPGADIQNGGMRDFGWWMSNMPQIASTLTLLFPVVGVSGAINFLGKLGKAGKLGTVGKFLSNGGKTVSKARRWASGVQKLEDGKLASAIGDVSEMTKFQAFVNNPVNITRANKAASSAAGGTLMRTIENYQEAKETHAQTYQLALDKFEKMSDEDYNLWLTNNQTLLNELSDKGIDIDNKDAVAKHIAKKAADRTFQMDFSNLIFDVIQLYSLKNIGKGVEKAAGKAVDEAQEASLRAAKSIATGVTEEIAKKPLIKRAGKGVADFAKYNFKTALTESTEGIEEAVNYIASQEGLTYGKALLEGNAQDYNANVFTGPFKSWANLQGNLKDYLKTSEIQESAFWGVWGGVVFHNANIGFNKLSAAMKRKADRKAREENPLTGEKIEGVTDSGYDAISLWDSPAQFAAKEAIHKRQARVAQLKDDLEQIKANKNIFADRNENGELPEFEGDPEIQQELARKRVESAFRADIAVDALNSGTFDYLLDYFQSNEVKQAMIATGATTAEEADSYIAQTVKELESVRDLYQKHSAHVLNQLSVLNADKNYGETIPLEYAQIIAKENVDRDLLIKSLDRQIAATEILAGQQAALDTELGKTENYSGAKEAVRFGSLLSMYSTLVADERALQETEPNDSLSRLQKHAKLEQLKAQKEGIINELKTLTLGGNAIGRSALFEAIRQSNRYRKNKQGKVILDNTNKYEQTDEEILKQVDDIFGQETNDVSNESIIQTAKALSSQLNNVLGASGIYESNRKLFDSFNTIAVLQAQRTANKALINTTIPQIKARIDYYHNMFNEGRKRIITKAEEIIRKAYEQYAGVNTETGQHIEEAIIEAYKGNRERAKEIAEQYLADSNENGNVTAAEFIDALDIFRFSSATNEGLFDWIADTIELERRRLNRRNRRTSQENATNQNQVSDSNNKDQTNSPLQPSESNSGQQNNRQRDVPGQKIAVKLNVNNQGRTVSIKRSNSRNSRNSRNSSTLDATVRDDGFVEINADELPKSKQLELVRNGLLVVDDDVDLQDTNSSWTISRNPILKPVGNGFTTKLVGKISKASEEQVTEQAPTSSPVEGNESTQPAQSQAPTQPTQPTQAASQPSNEPTSEPTEIPTQSNPSTGEGATPSIENTPSPTPAQPISNDQTTDPTAPQVDIPKITRGIALTFGNHITNLLAPDLDLDVVAEQVKEDLKDKAESVGVTQEELNRLIDEHRDNLKKTLEAIKSKTKLEQTASGTAYAAKYEEPDSTNYSTLFTTMAESFLKEYQKIILVPTVNGKQTVRLYDILRICNNVQESSDNIIARQLYSVIKGYLTSPEGKEKYVILDEAEGEKVLDKINKPQNQVQNEELVSVVERVNILDYIKLAEISSPTEKAAYFKALNSIQKGDKLSLVVTENALEIVKDGVTIGSMPKPKVRGDKYYVVNEGWVTDVKSDGNGGVISDAKNVILDLFLNDTKDNDDLRNLLTRVGMLDLTKPIPQELINEFESNPLIEKLYKESIEKAASNSNILFVENETGTINSDNVLKHLAKLWRYSNTAAIGINKRLVLNNVRMGVVKWFADRFNTYDSIANVKENVDVTVESISEGELIRATDKTKDEKYDYCNLATDGIADFANTKLAITDDNGNIDVSGREREPNKYFGRNNTFVVIYSRNPQPDYVHAFGVKANDKNAVASGSKIKTIGNAATVYLQDIMRNYLLSGNFANFNEIEKAIRNIIAEEKEGTSIPIFRAAKGNFYIEEFKDKIGQTGLQIRYTDGVITDRFYLYKTDSFGAKRFAYRSAPQTEREYKALPDYNPNNPPRIIYYNSSNKDTIGEQAANAFMSWVMKHAAINIDRNGIKLDNDPSFQPDGFITRKDGKVIVNIPGRMAYTEEFYSYNDYLIKNNLIKVNVAKNSDGSNFNKIGKSQGSNQKLSVSLGTKRTKVSKESSQIVLAEFSKLSNEVIEETSNVEQFNQAKEIISSNKETAGRELVELALGKEEADRFEKLAEEEDILDKLLPTRMIYHQGMNYYQNGSYKGSIAVTNGDGKHATYTGYPNGKKRTLRIRANEKIAVGYRFLNMISSNDIRRRKNAVRVMIHEKIHQILGENPNIKDAHLVAISKIYNEFDEVIKRDLATLDKNSEEYKKVKYLRDIFSQYKSRPDRLYEEFLAESLTNKTLIEYLNSIITTDTNNGKTETLFTKIARFIAKFFGIDIKDNSLYMKELNLLRELTDVSTEAVESTTVQEEIIEDISSPVEETTTEAPVEPTIDEQIESGEVDVDTFDIDDLDMEDLDVDDDGANLAANEEFNLNASNEVKLRNIEAFKQRLPTDIHSRFMAYAKSGLIEIHCS